LSAASPTAAADFVLGGIGLCVINVCKHDFSQTTLWMFAKFIAVTRYMLP